MAYWKRLYWGLFFCVIQEHANFVGEMSDHAATAIRQSTHFKKEAWSLTYMTQIPPKSMRVFPNTEGTVRTGDMSSGGGSVDQENWLYNAIFLMISMH